jgi:hypothetical protein
MNKEEFIQEKYDSYIYELIKAELKVPVYRVSQPNFVVH